MKLAYFLSCNPPKTTAQQKRVNHSTGKFFKGEKTLAAEAMIQALLLPYRPRDVMAGPLVVTIALTFPYLASQKKEKKAGITLPMVTRPDLDNWAKGFIDILASLRFIENDQSIYSLTLTKHFGPLPGIMVTIEDDAALKSERDRLKMARDPFGVDA